MYIYIYYIIIYPRLYPTKCIYILSLYIPLYPTKCIYIYIISLYILDYIPLNVYICIYIYIISLYIPLYPTKCIYIYIISLYILDYIPIKSLESLGLAPLHSCGDRFGFVPPSRALPHGAVRQGKKCGRGRV